MVIYTPCQIAEMPIISLECVDCLLGKGLKCVLDSIFDKIYNVFQHCVDLASETLTG
jgi:hypothetical protein